MAIYHLRASVISRSQGRSATAAIAYRAAVRIEDRRTGLVFDYARRGGVDHAEILAPDDAPDWVFDRSELWNRVEAAETRKNSQVAREVRVALPAELTHAARVELVRAFATEQFVARGMVADVALHAPGGAGDERNHHAHILLTTRQLGPDGFTAKDRDWNKVEVLGAWREAWARDTNAALERAGRDERVDHRTLEAQRGEALELAAVARDRGDEREELAQTVRAVALDRQPLPQLSPGAWQMKERGHEVGRVAAWYEVKARAAEVATLARDLAGHVRDWLDRAADRVLDRLGAERPETALAGRPAERDWVRERTDMAARLRGALSPSRDGGATVGGRGLDRDTDPGPDRAAPQEDLAARLRSAAEGIDHDALARGAAALREAREAEEGERAREAELARQCEVERQREIEREREARDAAERDRGWGLER